METKQKKNKFKIFKIIAIICVVILIIESLYLLIQYQKREQQRIYTDTASSFVVADDSYYIVGSSDFKNTVIGYQDGYQKAKFVKYSKDGKVEWIKAYTKGYNSIYNDVCKVNDGYIVVGHYEKTEQDHKENTGPGIIVKYDLKGNIVYEKEELILADTQFTKVKALKDGGYITFGQSIFENMTLGVDDRGGAIMIRYDKDGKEVWRTNFGGSKSGIFLDAYIDEDENAVYVVGKDASKYGVFGKYNLDGEKIFIKNYYPTDSIGFSSIDKIGDNFVVVGSKKLTEDKEDYHTQALFIEYSPNGEILLEKTYKKNEMSRFNHVMVQDNKIYVVGHSASLNEEKTTEALREFDYSGIYIAFDQKGKIIHSYEYKEKDADTYFSKILMDHKKWIITGQSNTKLFGMNKKDMHSFLIEINEKGKLQNQIF